MILEEEDELKIAIIDDDLMDVEKMISFIQKFCNKNGFSVDIEQYSGGKDFLQGFEKGKFDIIFLDIYMDTMDGMEVAEEIRKIDANGLLIFSTASREHAIQGFRVRAFDYIVKPYNYDQFEEVMKLCGNALHLKKAYIEVKQSRSMVKILIEDILYTDYYNHYVQIHTKKSLIKSYLPFREFEKLVESYPQFLSCYRNCLVNMDEIDSIENLDFLLKNGERVPIMRGRQNEIKQQYADYIFEKLESRF